MENTLFFEYLFLESFSRTNEVQMFHLFTSSPLGRSLHEALSSSCHGSVLGGGAASWTSTGPWQRTSYMKSTTSRLDLFPRHRFHPGVGIDLSNKRGAVIISRPVLVITLQVPALVKEPWCSPRGGNNVLTAITLKASHPKWLGCHGFGIKNKELPDVAMMSVCYHMGSPRLLCWTYDWWVYPNDGGNLHCRVSKKVAAVKMEIESKKMKSVGGNESVLNEKKTCFLTTWAQRRKQVAPLQTQTNSNLSKWHHNTRGTAHGSSYCLASGISNVPSRKMSPYAKSIWGRLSPHQTVSPNNFDSFSPHWGFTGGKRTHIVQPLSPHSSMLPQWQLLCGKHPRSQEKRRTNCEKGNFNFVTLLSRLLISFNMQHQEAERAQQLDQSQILSSLIVWLDDK